jgi:hypothetical protein
MTGSPDPTPAPRRGFVRRKAPLLMLLLVGAFALLALYIWGALSYTFTEGERAGYVQSFVRRGWLCKTWEGTLIVAAIPGMPAETFNFTVRDDATAQAINRRLGAPMRLHYRQHIGLPTSCFGDSAFFVDGAQPAEGLVPTPTPTPLPIPGGSPQPSPTASSPL